MPELVYGIFDVRFRLCWLPEKIAVVGLLAVILNLTPYGRFKVFFVVFFACCCLTQFCYMKYFGSWLTPYAVNFIFLEFSDILLEAKSIWRDYVFLVVLVGLPYFLLLFLWKRGIIRQFSFRYYPLLYILFFGYFFYQASTPEGIFQMLFKNTCCTAYNTINSFPPFLPMCCRNWTGKGAILSSFISAISIPPTGGIMTALRKYTDSAEPPTNGQTIMTMQCCLRTCFWTRSCAMPKPAE